MSVITLAPFDAHTAGRKAAAEIVVKLVRDRHEDLAAVADHRVASLYSDVVESLATSARYVWANDRNSIEFTPYAIKEAALAVSNDKPGTLNAEDATPIDKYALEQYTKEHGGLTHRIMWEVTELARKAGISFRTLIDEYPNLRELAHWSDYGCGCTAYEDLY